MALIDSLERRFGWLAFPGLIRTIAMLQAVMFVVLVMNPEAFERVQPNWEMVKKGEIWRLVAFVFLPPVLPGQFMVLSILFMLIAVRISFLFNDGLEQMLGEFRTSIYVYACIICQSFALHFFNIPALGVVYYTALFFLFATLYPHIEFLLFFIIPVKIWILAAFTGLLFFLGNITDPLMLLFYTASFLPYLIWAIPQALRWSKTRTTVASRRHRFEKAKRDIPTLHRCHECGRTELSDPDLEFRVAADGEEYCLDHLPTPPDPPA